MYSYRHNLPGTICRRISRVPLSDYKVFLLGNLSFLKQYCKRPPGGREICPLPGKSCGSRPVPRAGAEMVVPANVPEYPAIKNGGDRDGRTGVRSSGTAQERAGP